MLRIQIYISSRRPFTPVCPSACPSTAESLHSLHFLPFSYTDSFHSSTKGSSKSNTVRVNVNTILAGLGLVFGFVGVLLAVIATHSHDEDQFQLLNTPVPNRGYEFAGMMNSAEAGWHSTLPNMAMASSDMCAVVYNKDIFLVGGTIENNGQDTVSKYIQKHIASSSETIQLNTEIPTPRSRHTCQLVGSKIYIFGGKSDLDSDASTAVTDIYDIESNSWTTGADLPDLRSDLSSAVVGTDIYLISGYDNDYNSVAITYKYDTSADSYVKVADIDTPRGDLGCETFEGEIFCAGGFAAESLNSFDAPLDTFDKYDPVSDSWTALASMQNGRGDKATVVCHDMFVVVGGEGKYMLNTPVANNYGGMDNSASRPIRSVEAYVFATHQWINLMPIDYPRYRFAAARSEMVIHIFGGHVDTAATESNEIHEMDLEMSMYYHIKANGGHEGHSH